MQLKKGASVESSTGEKIGNLKHVVLDPESREVSHIIVEKGMFFTDDKVIQIQDIKEVGTDGKIVLGKTANEFDSAPTYDVSSYVTVGEEDYPDEPREELVDAVFWYPSLNTSWWGAGGPLWYPKPRYVRADKVIPEGQVVLEEGSKVISKDGKTIGTVKRVIVDPADNVATHIVISSGLLLKEEKMVPTLWIRNVEKDQVNLSVWSDMFDHLPDYEPAK